MKSHRIILAFLCYFSIILVFSQAEDWSFIQVSDLHVPYADSLSFIRSLQNVNTTYLEPYNITATKPAFIVATGDLTEFGGGAWNDYKKACAVTNFKWYHLAGNHDNTWRNIYPELQTEHGKPFYSWNYQGCHFVALNSATPQEPLPTFGREQIEWLRSDLQNVDVYTPIFVFFHHPFGGSEFASANEQLRVVELLRPFFNVFCIGGHYHRPKLSSYEGLPVIVGGQGYQDWAGYNVFSIQNGWLRVAYRKMSDANATIAVLEHRLIMPASKSKNLVKSGAKLKKFSAQNINSTIPQQPINLSIQNITSESEIMGQLWAVQLPSACKAGPSVGRHVYVATLEGIIYALDKADGKLVWAYPTQGAILGRVLVTPTGVLVGSMDGKVYCLDTNGSLLWVQNLSEPIYAPLALTGEQIIVSDRQGRVSALDISSGVILWQTKVANYTIESRACCADEKILVGAWDCYLTLLQSNDGSIIYKVKGVGSATKPAPTYYSPADCTAIISSDKFYATDRAYLLGAWNLSTGELIQQWEKVSAIALSEDGQALYLRKTTGELQKISLAGEILWTTSGICDSTPVAPFEADGQCYVCTSVGKLSIVSSSTGQIIAQIQITSGLRVYGEVVADNSSIYITDMDGKVTVIKRP